MSLLIFHTPGLDSISEMAASVLYLCIVTHWKRDGVEKLREKQRQTIGIERVRCCGAGDSFAERGQATFKQPFAARRKAEPFGKTCCRSAAAGGPGPQGLVSYSVCYIVLL